MRGPGDRGIAAPGEPLSHLRVWGAASLGTERGQGRVCGLLVCPSTCAAVHVWVWGWRCFSCHKGVGGPAAEVPSAEQGLCETACPCPPTPQGPALSLLPAMGDCKKLHELCCLIPLALGLMELLAPTVWPSARASSLRGCGLINPRLQAPEPASLLPRVTAGLAGVSEGCSVPPAQLLVGGAQADIAGSALGSLWGAELSFHGLL